MNEGRYSQTIARELVHKRAIGEVLITSVDSAPGAWVCRTQLPRRHSFHTDTTGEQCAYYDPLLVLEAFRQGCIASSHLFYDVALDARHTVRYYELTVVDRAALQRGTAMLDMEFTIDVRKEFRRGGDGPVQGLEVVAVVTHDETKVMEIAAAFGWMSAAKWDVFRAGASWDPGPQVLPADPALVGRTATENVVIGAPVRLSGQAGASAPLLVDIGHPTIFDHPLDHLPGGLIIEGGRQLALAILGCRGVSVTGPAWVRCDFQSFAEMDAPSTVTMTQAVGDPLAFKGELTQSGQTRATIELSFAAE